ncbi:MAG: LPS export ABC transporter periplasmic protein LptC [Candidatus Electrothrix sp. AW1]|nr:LPS export ABC transporter periplasmic protein LptC [Candidatus Electrothrix sp. AX1]MCI5181368.1 LPS export ABC transporter periplasmic protein LptC [Candidatus Electrothrix gigas]
MIGSYRNLLWIIPIGVLAASPLWKEHLAKFLKPRGGYDEIAQRAYQEQSQDFVMENVVISFVTQGLPTWTIKAKQAQTGTTDREIYMLAVDALYHKQGKSPIKITSMSGMYYMDDQHLTLTDDVVIIKPLQHEEMYSDLLYYYDSNKMLISPGPVEIKSPKFNLKGGSMDYNVSTGAYNFNNGVEVVLQGKE